MAETITVGIFPGAQMTPLYLARDRGWFAEAGLDVTLHEVRSSTEQLSGWDEGRFPIIHTTPDHFVRGARKVPGWFARRDALGEVVVMVREPVAADPAASRWAVDAPDSAFAFVLCAVLEARLGRAPARPSLSPEGGPPQRLKAIIEGRAAGAALNVPYDVMAAEAGLTRFGGHGDLYPDMASGVCVVARGFAASAAVRRYLAVRDRALDHLLALGETGFTGLLEVRGMTPTIAAATARALTGPFGLATPREVSRAALQPAIDLRRRFDPGWTVDEALVDTLITPPAGA